MVDRGCVYDRLDGTGRYDTGYLYDDDDIVVLELGGLYVQCCCYWGL